MRCPNRTPAGMTMRRVHPSFDGGRGDVDQRDRETVADEPRQVRIHALTISVPRSVADLLAIELADMAPDDLVFVSQRGGPLREGNWRRERIRRRGDRRRLGQLVNRPKGRLEVRRRDAARASPHCRIARDSAAPKS